MDTGFGERLKMARRLAGLSQQALAEQVGLSRMAISKYERGRMLPSSHVLIGLAQVLGQRAEFFLRGPVLPFVKPYDQGRVCLHGKSEEAVIAQLQEWLERYLAVEALFPPGEIPRFVYPGGFPRRVTSLEDVEAATLDLRHAWGLGNNPIENLTELLEAQGIKVGTVKGDDDFDACLFALENGDPVMAVRVGIPGDRQRFGLARELGHLLIEPTDGLDAERMANRFAGAFLLPQSAALYALGSKRRRLHPTELHMLKHRYGVSLQAWGHRAKDVGILNEKDMPAFWQMFNGNNWRKEEPGNALPPETPQRLVRLVMRALAENVISRSRAGELLGMSWPEFVKNQSQEYGDIPLAVRA